MHPSLIHAATRGVSTTITATFNGSSKTYTGTVREFSIKSVTFSADPIVAGDNVTGTVTINAPVSVDVTISLADLGTNPPAYLDEDSVVILAGSTTATFTMHSRDIWEPSRGCRVMASGLGKQREGDFTVLHV